MYLLKSNILSVQCLDQVLLAVDELEMSVLVPLADISSLEPAILVRCAGLLRVVVVLRRDRVTADPDLSLLGSVGGEVARIGEVDELDLDTGNQTSQGRIVPLQGVHDTALTTTVRIINTS